MQAVICHGYGDVDVMSFDEVPDLIPGVGEIVVRTVAAGVNRADLLQRQGYYPPPQGTSDVMGLEISGVVAAIGPDVSEWQIGQECVALLAGGGYATQVVVPAGQVMIPPPGMDLVAAAGVVEVAATVLSNLADELAAASRREVVFLAHGGAGGIGTFAIQYAKALGARVVATAGNARNLEHCYAMGADLALDYHDDWVAGLKEFSSKGADVILDIMGAKYLPLNVKALATDGHLRVIGLQGGRKGELDLSQLLSKRASIAATSLRYRSIAQKAAICRRVEAEIWPMFAEGKLAPGPQTRLPLAHADQAHRQLDSGENQGKIILVS
ncbi:MAG: NAD(P)H-quinone oxidoreductase [Propionibacteriaceae bacterium]